MQSVLMGKLRVRGANDRCPGGRGFLLRPGGFGGSGSQSVRLLVLLRVRGWCRTVDQMREESRRGPVAMLSYISLRGRGRLVAGAIEVCLWCL